jgi:hypothetical protein
MASKPSNRKGPVPKYQNNFTFYHNKNSAKTRDILALPASVGCCHRCTAIIEWKRK